ncbi:hypothetical protein AGR2A_Lc20041 [Agrobacterium genomosp. 2 str. CFBP 5494]|uniref:Uncharacterized protein n=1 Tax=Agrobacterium genomosp. 2 str. CFBP 5494 TaxID=1183436 RepID=A0A9W5B4C4_9HYPH|nr:hypothetical protein BA725_07795 [Agrobacterium pusense]CUW96903.1 hypothetical protein AGR2A_Lc20041 [Agrobacterium genomosp. 2 str. CFBP 5494]
MLHSGAFFTSRQEWTARLAQAFLTRGKQRDISMLPTIADVQHQGSTFAITALCTLTFASMTP